MIIAKAAIENIKKELDLHKIKGSQYKINIVEKINSESIEKAEIITSIVNKFIENIGRKIVTLINKAILHIETADSLLEKELKLTPDDASNICEKKILSVLTIAQASLINADKIFSKSLEKSKNKDMITKDIIEDSLNIVDELLDWIDDKFDYLSKFTNKLEFDLIVQRANNYISIVDKENCLI
jgi:hypothetical protein